MPPNWVQPQLNAKMNSQMKTLTILFSLLLLAPFAPGQPMVPPANQPGWPPPVRPPFLSPASTPGNESNYLIHIEWSDGQGASKTLEVVTGAGHVSYDGFLKSSVKIGGSDIPATLKFTGTLSVLSPEKGRLELYLGRNVPYVTSAYGLAGVASYSQMSVGIQTTMVITFGKPIVIQSDDNGIVTVLVKSLTD